MGCPHFSQKQTCVCVCVCVRVSCVCVFAEAVTGFSRCPESSDVTRQDLWALFLSWRDELFTQ